MERLGQVLELQFPAERAVHAHRSLNVLQLQVVAPARYFHRAAGIHYPHHVAALHVHFHAAADLAQPHAGVVATDQDAARDIGGVVSAVTAAALDTRPARDRHFEVHRYLPLRRDALEVGANEHAVALRHHFERTLLVGMVRIGLVVGPDRAAAGNLDLRHVAAVDADVAFEVVEQDARFVANRFLLG